ncbi:RBBP9/YdeN family alpha/beta hydrolase [Paracoccus aminophilus]|uniref:Esterase n=1 Tax=Paracoccus aminophilus JCM 7686 TaxID=1367847 RepID=S5XT26_PARAH|nr:alpha/beta fold hydrolase [Paracoccus aminophilus]AGT08302.1 esterase [Paracoccus aminophilus JCM 7686]
MTRTLLVPGLEGSPAPHWQHWWALTDPRAITVDLSDPGSPDPIIWEAELAGQILQHPDSVLVGHSLGAVLITRILAKWPQLRVRAAMLVAPADPAEHSRIGGFAPVAEHALSVPAMVIASRNDPWMGFERLRQLSRAWRADFVDLGDAGHINSEAGYGPWPQGKALRDELLARSATDPDGAHPGDVLTLTRRKTTV